jgi:hypothetical protein
VGSEGLAVGGVGASERDSALMTVEDSGWRPIERLAERNEDGTRSQ